MPLDISGCASFKIRQIELDGEGVITGSFDYEYSDTVSSGTQDFWNNTNRFTEISQDTSPELGGDLEIGTNHLILTEVVTSTQAYSGNAKLGIIKTGSGGLFYLRYQGSDGEFVNADNSDYTKRCTHMSVTSFDGSQKLLKEGIVKYSPWTWTPGQDIYLSGTGLGQMTQDVSGYTTGDIIQVIGRAIDATTVAFDPEKGGIEVL